MKPFSLPLIKALVCVEKFRFQQALKFSSQFLLGKKLELDDIALLIKKGLSVQLENKRNESER
jgi:hypothetical protein